MRIAWRTWNRVGAVAALVVAVVLHAVLKWHLAGSTAAAAVFTLGGGAPALPLLEVAALVLLRLLVVLVLPGLLLAEAGMWAADRWRAGRSPVPPAPADDGLA